MYLFFTPAHNACMGAQESCHKSLCLSANADADGNAYLPTSCMESDLDTTG